MCQFIKMPLMLRCLTDLICWSGDGLSTHEPLLGRLIDLKGNRSAFRPHSSSFVLIYMRLTQHYLWNGFGTRVSNLERIRCEQPNTHEQQRSIKLAIGRIDDFLVNVVLILTIRVLVGSIDL